MESQSPAIPKWSALLIEAVTKPGLIMKAYSAFHQYSVGNQILALVQCQMRGLQPGHLFIVSKPLSKLRRIGAKIAPRHDVIIGRNVRLV